LQSFVALFFWPVIVMAGLDPAIHAAALKCLDI
jgi:hypothetical protein